ncbi:YjbH domain-containing protein [Sulfitobacter sp. 1A16787]|uniref:YjbH domain-containing protein n=1 Tax=Sulfitobacter sp. 1A16787 TaxID=3368571 RepID=UPI003745D43D
MRLQGFSIAGEAATIKIANNRGDVEAQAAGPAERVLAETLSPNIENFAIVFLQNGVSISKVVTRRSDLEELQFDYHGAWQTLARAEIKDADGIDKVADQQAITVQITSSGRMMFSRVSEGAGAGKPFQLPRLRSRRARCDPNR